jgi:Rieske Fe-S protein
MERRQFIRDSCKLCVGFAGVTVFSSLLTSCTPLPIYNTEYKDKKVVIPILQFAKTNFVIARCINLNYDIAVIKQADSTYRSFIMQCTHADNPVEYNGNEFTCSLHGSIFNGNGDVRRGPAEKALKALRTEVVDSDVVIHS